MNEYGRDLGEGLKPGAVVALTGELGTGKTTLAKAIADGLAVTECVTSPTFTIINEYLSGRLPLYHFDVYRLCMFDIPVSDEENCFPNDHEVSSSSGAVIVADALADIGYEEYFYGDGVTIIEWADMIKDLLPVGTIHIELRYTGDPEKRCVKADPETQRVLEKTSIISVADNCVSDVVSGDSDDI